jgi:trimethylamine:corrinoid methyltransferase-like protein
MYRIENRRTGCADKPCIGEYFTSQSMDEIISGALDILARIGIRIHTWAKRAGVQAAVEKSTLMMAGALNGASYFDGLGTISLDEVFSPVQLVLDIEIMNHVSRVVAGMSVDAMPSDLCGMIAEGLDRGYIGSDLTLDHHDSYIWYPDLFDRSNLQSWLSRGEGDALDRAREIVLGILAKPAEFALKASKKKALDEIYSKALQDAGQQV